MDTLTWRYRTWPEGTIPAPPSHPGACERPSILSLPVLEGSWQGWQAELFEIRAVFWLRSSEFTGPAAKPPPPISRYSLLNSRRAEVATVWRPTAGDPW